MVGALSVLVGVLSGCSKSCKELEAEGQLELARKAEVESVRATFSKWVLDKLDRNRNDMAFWNMSVESSACASAWTSQLLGTQDDSVVNKVADKRYEVRATYWLRGRDSRGDQRKIRRDIVGVVAQSPDPAPGGAWQVTSHEFKHEKTLTSAVELGTWLSLSLLPFMVCWLLLMTFLGVVYGVLSDLSERLAGVVFAIGFAIGTLVGGVLSVVELSTISSWCFGPQPVAWVATVLGSVLGLCLLTLLVLDWRASDEALLAWTPMMVSGSIVACVAAGGPALWIATGIALVVGASLIAVIAKARGSGLLLLNAVGLSVVGLAIGLAGILV